MQYLGLDDLEEDSHPLDAQDPLEGSRLFCTQPYELSLESGVQPNIGLGNFQKKCLTIGNVDVTSRFFAFWNK